MQTLFNCKINVRLKEINVAFLMGLELGLYFPSCSASLLECFSGKIQGARQASVLAPKEEAASGEVSAGGGCLAEEWDGPPKWLSRKSVHALSSHDSPKASAL